METYTLTRLKHSELHPNSYNRSTVDGQTRSGFDAKSLGELADSIRAQGIIQPLIVRKITGQAGFEIVAGERRWTAAGIVNKKLELPCIVRPLSDAQARELTTIENLQRVGLHPIEEARGYEDLLALTVTPRYTMESLATKVGKSVSFLYARLKLLRAPLLAQSASFRGKLNHSCLLLVARIPDPKLAHQATLEILDPLTHDEKAALDPHVEPLSYRAAKKLVQDKYMISLKDAPFDPKDETLVPITWEVFAADGTRSVTTGAPPTDAGLTVNRLCGGKCGDCPSLTGNLKALFKDVESSDVCTHTPCYKKKVAADFKAREAKAKDNGDVLLKDRQAEKLFDQGHLITHEFVDLDAVFPGEKKKTWEAVLGKAVPDSLTQARDDQGKVHFLLPMTRVADALEAAGVKAPPALLPRGAATPPVADSPEARAQVQAEREAQVATAKTIEAAALVQLRAKVAKLKPNADFFRDLVADLLDRDDLMERHGLKNDQALGAFLKKRTEAELRALLVEAVFFARNVAWNGEFTDTFTAGCKAYGVDLKAIAKQVAKTAKA